MDVSTKLAILADAAKYDASCASSGTTKRNSRDGGLGSTTGAGICHSYTPDGRCVSLLKILLTNFCIYDCQYCINRISSDVRRARFTPEEVVNLTLDFYRRNYIEGLFLSSGIIRNPDYTMEQVVKVAQTLRQEHKFRGYIHLKTIPEASPDLIAQAGRWADRISINVELPTPQDLDRLAPEKNLTRIRSTMGVIRDRISEGKAEVRQSRLAPPFAPAGQSTQMIIGATPTPDRQILEQASSLYGEQKLRRVYYSAFSPIPHASKNLPLVAPPLVREHRLYQADWLLRFYGFSVGELTTPEAPDLPLGIDPKLAWALRHPEQFPVDLQRAPREMLLRIPGLGVRNVDRLLQVRRWHRVTLADLARLRISLKKVQPFITTVDYKPKIVGGQRWASSIQPVKQMELFAPEPRLQRSNIIMLRQITFAPHFRGWQTAARRALSSDWRPEEILWQELHDDQPLLDLAAELEPAAASASPIKTPKSFIEMARRVACHFDPARWSLLYRILWRITHGERHLLEIVVDPDVQKLSEMDKSVRRDVHKMRAFVRFRAVEHDGVKWYVAWFESQCHIVELNAPFFVDRFANMPWSILTPDLCAHWDEKNLTFTEGVSRSAAPTEDAAESLWIQYYSSIFNPARVKVHAMQKEMPKLYWKNLPEAAVIPALLNKAPSRVMEMIDMSQKNSATPATHPAVVPRTTSLKVLRDAAQSCKACPLYRDATQVVFGEGPTTARVVLLGEQPGDSEDRAGRPFIGPAGQLLDRALQEAGLNRADTYVTNAVKHFKFELRGKRRLHKSPSPREIAACRPWLMAEMQLIKPQILVCLGASAAHSVFGRTVKVLSERGTFSPTDFSPLTFVTVHPSSLLRAPDEEARAHQYQLFLHDLRQVAHRLLS